MFKSGFDNYPDRFLLINYEEIVLHPQKTMDRVCSFLEQPKYKVNFENIVDHMPEQGRIDGVPGLHAVHSSLKRHSPQAVEVLGQDCYDYWTKQNLEFWSQ